MKEDKCKRPCIIQFHLFEMSRKGKYIETGSRLVVAWGWEGDQEVNPNGSTVLTFWGDGNVLKLGCDDDHNSEN